jgi:predicted flap endonuclease-1-like 5' DNA nuclease
MYKTTRYLSLLGIGLSASAFVGWLLLRENKRAREGTSVTIKSQRASETAEPPQIVLPLADLESDEEVSLVDDLTELKDIGPRFAEALRQAGITRFAQLAKETPEGLAERLAPYVTVRSGRIRENNWIGQAAQRVSR